MAIHSIVRSNFGGHNECLLRLELETVIFDKTLTINTISYLFLYLEEHFVMDIFTLILVHVPGSYGMGKLSAYCTDKINFHQKICQLKD